MLLTPNGSLCHYLPAANNVASREFAECSFSPLSLPLTYKEVLEYNTSVACACLLKKGEADKNVFVFCQSFLRYAL